MRVLIVDDHAAVRRGVRSAVEGRDDLEVVGEAGNGEEAIEQAATLHPDLIIMDISMPVLDGLSAAEIILKFHPETRILAFSMYAVKDFIETARDLGLSGYVTKEGAGSSLLHAVDAIMHHKTYFPA
jgi:two-component system nitrate/nitrite response regulator NarL